LELTDLIQLARGGSKDAADKLFAEVYSNLHRIALKQLRDHPAPMGATSLVHEAYFRLSRPESLGQQDRHHFYAVAARAMRQILIDRARQRLAQKRGGDADVTDLDGRQHEAMAEREGNHMLALDRALTELQALDARLAQLVELRFFGGLTLDEAADAAAVSRTTVKRDWRRARAWLHAALGEAS
jgi:RNA polymerase sigma factor (TIGR02999 family)